MALKGKKSFEGQIRGIRYIALILAILLIVDIALNAWKLLK